MTPDSVNADPTPAGGRPRDDAREQAILDATLALVSEVGYERLTMDAVAGRAKASKATIYRRWAGKEELVVAAMHSYVGTSPEEPKNTGSLRGDLSVLCRAMTDIIKGFDGHLILGLAQAVLSSPDLCQALEEQTGASKARPPRIVVERAIARGELPADANHLLINEIALPVVIMRLMSGQPIDGEFLDHVVDDILIPALGHPAHLSPTPRPQVLSETIVQTAPRSTP